MTSSNKLANALLQSDSVIQGLKKELRQEQRIYDKLNEELKEEIKNHLNTVLNDKINYKFDLKLLPDSEVRNGFEITNLKRIMNNDELDSIKELLGVNSYSIHIRSNPSKIVFHNKEDY